MSSNADPVVAEQVFEAPISVVWEAVTDKDQMRQWFFAPMTEFEPEVGFETEFIVECEGMDYPHHWKILEVVPQEKIVYRWRYGGYPGDSTVTWELSETPDGTLLVLTHRGHETFPRDNPIFSRESCQGGWDYFVCKTLKSFLDGPKD